MQLFLVVRAQSGCSSGENVVHPVGRAACLRAIACLLDPAHPVVAVSADLRHHHPVNPIAT